MTSHDTVHAAIGYQALIFETKGFVLGTKEEAFEVEGTVTQALANTRFRVQLETGTEVMAHVAGRMESISFVSCQVIRCGSNYHPMTSPRAESSIESVKPSNELTSAGSIQIKARSQLSFSDRFGSPVG